jgi:hypothetical protein
MLRDVLKLFLSLHYGVGRSHQNEISSSHVEVLQRSMHVQKQKKKLDRILSKEETKKGMKSKRVTHRSRTETSSFLNEASIGRRCALGWAACIEIIVKIGHRYIATLSIGSSCSNNGKSMPKAAIR